MRLALRSGNALLQTASIVPLYIRKENKILNLLLALPEPDEEKAPYFEISVVDEDLIKRVHQTTIISSQKQFRTHARIQAIYHGFDLLEELSEKEVEEGPDSIDYHYVEFDAEMACSILDIDPDVKNFGEEKFGKKKLQWRKIGNSENIELNITGPFEKTEGLVSTELSIDELSLIKSYIKQNIPTLMGWKRLCVPYISQEELLTEEQIEIIDAMYTKLTKKPEQSPLPEDVESDSKEVDNFKAGPLDFVKFKKELEKRKGDHPNKPVAEAKPVETKTASPADESATTAKKPQEQNANKKSE